MEGLNFTPANLLGYINELDLIKVNVNVSKGANLFTSLFTKLIYTIQTKNKLLLFNTYLVVWYADSVQNTRTITLFFFQRTTGDPYISENKWDILVLLH